jgi:hypothetical protein
VFYLSDEMFALDTPMLITIDAHSTSLLKIARATDRSAETWRAPCAALEQHHFMSLGMASDRGTGLVAGSQAAGDMALWVADYFHAVRDLYEVLHQLERKAYAAMDKAYEAARTFANAKSEAHLRKRLAHYDTAHRPCEQAMALYDQCALLLHLLREALHLCSPQGRLRTPAHVRSELLLLCDMLDALDSAALRKTLTSLRLHLDDLGVPFQHAEAIGADLRAIVPHEALDCLVLAWHHDHFVHQAGSKTKGYPQRERDCWRACAAGLLGDAFDTFNALVVDKLDSIIRASSLVEMVNGLIRPSLNSCQGQITQETLNLIMFYHNHRRSKSGKRQGKAPRELLTGEPVETPWWELFRRQLTTEQGVTDSISVPARPPLRLVPLHTGATAQQAMAVKQAFLDPPDAAEHERQQQHSQAASAFPRCSHAAFIRDLLEGPACAYITPYPRSSKELLPGRDG